MNFDAIVIGAGAMGSAAAYYLSRSGQKTLLLEQFHRDHQLGSSHGYSRIIRYAYAHPVYIRMAKMVYPLWQALEAEAEETLYIKTGGLDFAKADNVHFLATRQAMADSGVIFEELSPQEVASRFPLFRLDEDMRAIYQADAGALRVSRCITAHVRLATERYGATFLENVTVHNIIPFANSVTVETSQGTFSAGRLVLGAGSWSQPLLARLGVTLPLEVMRQQVVFFDVPPEYGADRVPIFIAWGDPHFYGIGDVDHTGFKCAQHYGGEIVTPETVKRTVDESYVEHIRAFARRHLPAIAENPICEASVCLYTNTPDENFVIDHHPQYPHIAFGAGFSGHGFKFSTLVGKMLADIASQHPIEINLDLFRSDRFKK